ncbi:MAG: hypothetical protein ACO1SV_09770 [Fimbriimonas sp.]
MAELQKVLVKVKQAARANDTGPTKRRGNDVLVRYLALALDNPATLRPAEAYRAKSYNLRRQVIQLVDHLYIRYRVPLFLYRTVLSPEGIDLVFGDALIKPTKRGRPLPDYTYRSWFLAVARGESFAKVARSVFTKREAHWFLQAPEDNSIEANIFWAKAAAAGVPRDACDYLVERLDAQTRARIGARMPDLLRLYIEAWPQMRGYDRDEITDFVRTIALDRSFSFKG